MCVIFFAYRKHPEIPLILLANRDEFYDRPTAAARFWSDFPEIFAGRDLAGGGTWLGVSKKGRFAAVTNYRDPSAQAGTNSRGHLVADFLKTDIPAEIYLEEVKNRRLEFSGFNLLAGEINPQKNELYYFSNRGRRVEKLDAGIYGLSNHLLDTPWRKVVTGKSALAKMLEHDRIAKEPLFEILADEALADDGELPDTGIGRERERLLSAIFIKTPVYGTRCSTVLTFDREFKFDFDERVFV